MEMTKDFVLTDIEKDVVGEIANICMGSAATALSTILGKKVEITTPTVSQSAWKDLYKEPRGEYVCVQVSYIEGIEGNNVLLLDVKDAISIANMMMGTTDNTELSEIELSAVGEATNQMIGASTTTLLYPSSRLYLPFELIVISVSFLFCSLIPSSFPTT